MKEIVQRLQEKRNIEVAKSILESAGYTVKRKSLHEGFKPAKAKIGDLYINTGNLTTFMIFDNKEDALSPSYSKALLHSGGYSKEKHLGY